MLVINLTFHIEVVLDDEGNFRTGRTRKLEWNESLTLTPSTEDSAGRTAGIAPHPLCEEVGYCAADWPDADAKKISAYMEQLSEWCDSEFSHPKARAVLKYLRKNRLWADLDAEKVFPLTISNRSGHEGLV